MSHSIELPRPSPWVEFIPDWIIHGLTSSDRFFMAAQVLLFPLYILHRCMEVLMRSFTGPFVQIRRGDPTLLVELTSGVILTGMSLWMIFGQPNMYLHRPIRTILPAWAWIYIILTTGLAQIITGYLRSRLWRAYCTGVGTAVWALLFGLFAVRGINLAHFFIGPFAAACLISYFALIGTDDGPAQQRHNIELG